ncbi:hypothetical protein PENSPDRAFT_351967 [Peniophora sp. CONT]|nr:hypothetical protein PENSPDRAFT_351967 [Peniophora sp. CONT]
MLKVFKRVASRRIKDYFFVLCGNTDVKDALKKLEALAMKEQRTATADIHMDVRNVQSEVVEILDITVNNDLHSWLDPPTQRSIDDEKKRPQDSSCRWFFDDAEFKNWKACDNGIYWVYGNGASQSSS